MPKGEITVKFVRDGIRLFSENRRDVFGRNRESNPTQLVGQGRRAGRTFHAHVGTYLKRRIG